MHRKASTLIETTTMNSRRLRFDYDVVEKVARIERTSNDNRVESYIGLPASKDSSKKVSIEAYLYATMLQCCLGCGWLGSLTSVFLIRISQREQRYLQQKLQGKIERQRTTQIKLNCFETSIKPGWIVNLTNILWFRFRDTNLRFSYPNCHFRIWFLEGSAAKLLG